MASTELTLIVAATRNMGIGAHGGMPWKGLRKEMAYFARVTAGRSSPDRPGSLNAVIMGRKTWDSIPPRFRPLQNRLNIIVSRSHPPPPSLPGQEDEKNGVWMPSLESAVEYTHARSSSSSSSSPASSPLINRVFVIGGAQIYDAALKLPQARRVLLTSIQRDFDECDTFFPLHLLGADGPAPDGWRKRSVEQWRAWTGEEDTEERQEEAGTAYEFQMWERDKT